MSSRVDDQPNLDLEDVYAAQVARGEFANAEEARADFLASLDEAIAEDEAGLSVDAEVVFAELRERYANWPRAAE